MLIGRVLPLTAGAAVTAVLAIFAGHSSGPALSAKLARQAQQAIADAGGQGVRARFTTAQGWSTRHPVLHGGEGLDEATRARTARAVAAIPGVGGVRWANGSAVFSGLKEPPRPLHCQDDVDALLRSRILRFEEGSAAIDPASIELIDEVADALRPCLGGIIAITGHTDTSGSEPGNLALSRERAETVQRALIRRGIPADGLRATGLGSKQPVEGLDPSDPANRRIEFAVIETVPIHPTPIDTPGPR